MIAVVRFPRSQTAEFERRSGLTFGPDEGEYPLRDWIQEASFQGKPVDWWTPGRLRNYAMGQASENSSTEADADHWRAVIGSGRLIVLIETGDPATATVWIYRIAG